MENEWIRIVPVIVAEYGSEQQQRGRRNGPIQICFREDFLIAKSQIEKAVGAQISIVIRIIINPILF
jgi:hypothetical protein